MSSKQFDVWAVVQDPGETAGMLPVVDELHKAGISVRLYAAGKALEILAKESREHVPIAGAEELVRSQPAPRVLLVSTSYGGGVGRDLVPLLRGTSATVLLQSLWSGLAGWEDVRYQPDFVITNDKAGLATISSVWPGMDPARVHQTGFPMLDAYAALDAQAESAAVRRALGIGDLPLVLFAGQAAPTGAMLFELVEVLNKLKEDFYFLPRPHPRTKIDYPSEMEPWQQALAKFRGRLVVDYFGSCTTPQLVAAAVRGAVVSMYSTVLLEAAAARAAAISMMYPAALRAFQEENPGLSQFPLVELGCASLAHDRASLERHLDSAIGGHNPCRAQQEVRVRMDGQNARRAADVIQGLL